MSQRQQLIGRAPQLETIRARLADPIHRVLTLRGPGGVGKTTLARNIAADRTAPFVELDVCADIDGVAAAVGEMLGLPEVLRNFEGVHQALVEGDVDLVILDNAEHLTEAVEHVVAGWLEGSHTRFLITSREHTGVQGETIVDVMPLEDDDALELFELRAREASHGFELDDSNREAARELIDLIDGLPLAIELAAARMRILTPRQICERLGQQFELLKNRGQVIDRHATLHACVQWSWDLLDDDLREALRQVAIFRGRFTIEEAEGVLETAGWAGDHIQELVDRSLIWVERVDQTMRFAVYDGVRRFVDWQTSPDAPLIERYTRFLLERVKGHLLSHRDFGNVFHAFDLCIDARPELAIELLLETRQKLWRSGYLSRLFTLLDRGLEVPELDPMWRAGLHAALATCHYALMEFDLMEEQLSAAEVLISDDPRDYATRTRSQMALLRAVRADECQHREAAEKFFEVARQSLDVLPAAHKAHLFAASGLAELRRGEFDVAIAWFERSIKSARQCPDRVLLARTLTWSANGYIADNQIDRAVASIEEALEIYDEHEDIVSLAVAEYSLAQALVRKDRKRAIIVARKAMASATVARLRIVEATTQVLVARLEPSPESVVAIRRAMRVFGEDSSHDDRWCAWVSLLVVLIRIGELDIAVQEASSLVAATLRGATDDEVEWCRRYLAVVHALRGDLEKMRASIDDKPFRTVIEEALDKGAISKADQNRWDNPYLRLVHDFAPSPLELLEEGLRRDDVRSMRLIDDGATAILPDGTEIDLETRYVLRRLLLALCDARDERPGTAMTLEELVESGWPDESMTYESGIRRVYSAIRNLRKLGLEQVVLTGENGYLVDPDLRIVRV